MTDRGESPIEGPEPAPVGPLEVPVALTTSRSVQGLGALVGVVLGGGAALAASTGHHFSSLEQILAIIVFGVFGALAGWAVAVDIVEHRLPNRLTYPLIPAAAVSLIVLSLILGEPRRISVALFSGLLAGGVFFVAALVTPSGIGMGDAKFAVTTTMLAGWWSPVSAVWAIFNAFWMAGIFVLIAYAARRVNARTAIPFGPFLFAGMALAIFWNMSASPFSW
ncbi:MAG: A24 family peptidase [Bowdeniella nasicola]|nr:A24 family peptidase [Bowdeniella nasicola]